MKKIQIKNRYTDEIIVEMEAESIREVVEKNRASLSGADLSWVDLSGAKLYGADLSGADLSGAKLYGAELSGAKLSGADLSGAKLSGAKIKVTQKEELLKSLSIVIEG